eukprot:4721909-Prymnesium_polylepis.1
MAILGSRILGRPSTATACARSIAAFVEAALDALAGERASARISLNHGCFVFPSGAVTFSDSRPSSHTLKRSHPAAACSA